MQPNSAEGVVAADPAANPGANPAADAVALALRIRRRRRGNRIASAVLLLVCGLVASIGVPNLMSTRRNHNESMVIATLKNISSAQSQCQASGAIDVDGNGAGEYGFFAELAGGVSLPNGKPPMAPPVLSKAFADVVGGRVHCSGYLFEMVLPDARMHGVRESDRGGRAGAGPVAATHAETLWACYAWPIERDGTGHRAFFVSQSGDVLTTNGAVRGYDGERVPMRWDAAFAQSESCTMGSPVAANTVGNDGNTWVVV